MKSWLDPWPAVADLFAGLSVATFAGLVLFATMAGYQGGISRRVDEKVKAISDNVMVGLQKELGGVVRKCKEYGNEFDRCLDITINFQTNSYDIPQADKPLLVAACRSLKKVLDENKGYANQVMIFIDGHADQRPPRRFSDEEAKESFNWVLSSERAVSVLYQFSRCGIKPPEYMIRAVGFGSSIPHPDCQDRIADSPACQTKNRRTTFRVRVDTWKVWRTLEIASAK